MYFNDREKRRLLKVKTKLGDMWEGNLRRYHVTPHTAREIANRYNALVKAPETLSRETISYDVKNFFGKNGFVVENYGIGWKIYVSERLRDEERDRL